jgi:hypothetical protein
MAGAHVSLDSAQRTSDKLTALLDWGDLGSWRNTPKTGTNTRDVTWLLTFQLPLLINAARKRIIRGGGWEIILSKILQIEKLLTHLLVWFVVVTTTPKNENSQIQKDFFFAIQFLAVDVRHLGFFFYKKTSFNLIIF